MWSGLEGSLLTFCVRGPLSKPFQADPQNALLEPPKSPSAHLRWARRLYDHLFLLDIGFRAMSQSRAPNRAAISANAPRLE